MMKRIVVLLMVLTLASIAGFAEGKKDAPAAQSNVSAPGIFPIVKTPWTMKVMMPQSSLVQDYETNKFTKYMEAKTGIKVQWQLVPEKNVQEKVNLILAAGTDLPDVIQGTGLSKDAMVSYGSQGLIIPLNAYIETQSTEFKKVLAKLPRFKAEMTAPDGNIYWLPKISESFQNEYAQRLYINQTWLDKLGLKMPTTTEEFYQVLKAFKTQDPNGNGKADEIPFTGAITGWHTEIDAQIMSSFIYNDGRNQNRMVVKNGKVDTVYDKNEWREGLRFMNRLAKEGLLDPSAFTQDVNQLKQLVGNSSAMLVGAVTGGTIGGFIPLSSPYAKQYSLLPPLAGPKGIKTTGYFPTAPQQGTFVITKTNPNPEASFRWGDWLYNEEPSLFMRFGEKGTDWVPAVAGEVDPFGEPALLKPILLWATNQNSHWTFNNPGYSTRRMQTGQVVDPKVWSNDGSFIRETTIYEKVAPPISEILPNLFFTEAEIDEILDLKTSINKYVEESIAKFTVGYIDIEKDWDKYLKDLDTMDLKRLIALTQQAYDRQAKVK